MTVNDLVAYLRHNVNIQQPLITDTAYLSMTDEQILLYMQVALNRNFPKYSIESIPETLVYPVILLSKKELYYALATIDAPLYDLGADNNNYLRRSQRFKHYTELIAIIDAEYESWLENGGSDANTITSYNVFLGNRYATKRNIQFGAVPKVEVYIDSVTDSTCEISWEVADLNTFFNYNVYISTSPILDTYSIGNPISDSADLVAQIKDIHQMRCRIENLLPNTLYYIVVSATALNLLTGYGENFITTEEVVEDG